MPRLMGVGRGRGVGRFLGVRNGRDVPVGLAVAAGVVMGGRLDPCVALGTSIREDSVVAVTAVSDASSSAIAAVRIFQPELFSGIRVLFMSMFWVENPNYPK
jgi:hypothetical protein